MLGSLVTANAPGGCRCECEGRQRRQEAESNAMRSVSCDGVLLDLGG